MLARACLFICIICVLLAGSAAAARPIVARGAWAGFDRGRACEAVSRSIRLARDGEDQPRIAVAFDRGGPRHGQFSARLRRPARPGSTVLATIGDQPFQLFVRGANAWSVGPAQELAIIAAMRGAGGLRIDARDIAGRRMIDRYLLDGAPTAIDAAAAACSRR